MRILVKHVDVTADGDVRLSFDASAGEGVATCRGSIRPVVDGKYDGELDLPFVLDKKKCRSIDGPVPRLEVRGGGTVVRAIVEGVEEDNVVYLRLGDDSLFLVETAGGFAPGEAIQLLLSPEQLVLTLTGADHPRS